MLIGNRTYQVKPCIKCKSHQFGIHKVDLTVISETICETCASSMTIQEFTNLFKWKPTLIQNKILNQILKIYKANDNKDTD